MTDQISIPTLPDLMRGIERWMEAQATGDGIPGELQAEVDRVLDGPAGNVDHLFTFLAFARGCHTVAEERRQRDDWANALCYHHFGQIMIEHAVNLLARLAAEDIRRIGETRH
ncbi:MAG: hypothetical protein JNK47_10795 [Mesorhizobium sp.]|nr:hypothetical protein [Mesorhizobium sp.]MBL8577705.1 hypothetical protein [Mesorhizobium sp.]